MKKKTIIYNKYIKRGLDFFVSLLAIIILSPLLILVSIISFFAMKGNPFFCQDRPGKGGEIFKLIKFRSMSNAKDKNGELLPDYERLNSYGIFLRKTSIDELPELFNILKGDMSIVGPRPLAVEYLPYYNENESRRHNVRPGLTGLAQVNGRNAVNWPERFAYDLEYVDNVSFILDFKIILKTIGTVFKRSDITVRGTTTIMDFDKFRIQQWKEEKGTIDHD